MEKTPYCDLNVSICPGSWDLYNTTGRWLASDPLSAVDVHLFLCLYMRADTQLEPHTQGTTNHIFLWNLCHICCFRSLMSFE